MSSSTMAQTQGRVTYISQQNPFVDITPAAPDDTTVWLAASMTPQKSRHLAPSTQSMSGLFSPMDLKGDTQDGSLTRPFRSSLPLSIGPHGHR